MKKNVLKVLNTTLDILEFILAAIIMIVFVLVIGIEVCGLISDPAVLPKEGFLDTFLSSIITLVVEFVKMLLHSTAFNVLELLILALSRYVVLNHHDHWAIAVGVSCIVALFAVRHLLVAKSHLREKKEDKQLVETQI